MIGTVLGSRYELAGLLVDGPIFAAYSALDRTTGRDVCVRVVKPPFNHHPDFAEGLRETVGRYAVVRSQHLEAIDKVEQDEQNLFLVSDLTRGPTLADRIRKLAPFSVPVSVATAISACEALEPLHRLGMAHGDLTPNNVAVLADGEVRLQLAGIWEAYSSSPTAGAMVLPGMAPYLAPEVSSGGMPSPTSDVYALGIILYELLTGRRPYFGDTPIAIALQHATSHTPSVRAINPSVPAVLDHIILKAMAKNPTERYRDAGVLLADLRLLQDALRFGRSLTWPLRPEDAPSDSAAKPKQSSGAPKKSATKPSASVAPRMSAIRSEEDVERRRNKPDRDVPIWMTMLIVFLGAVVLSLLGVWMMLNLNRPQLVTVPNVIGLSIEEARAVLKENSLELKIEARVPSETIEMDKVLEVMPKAGEKVRENTRVLVTLSSGSRMVAVPDLRGLTIDRAKTVLNSLNLEMDTEILRISDSSVGEGLVVRTTPPARSKVERQSSVKLVVSSGSQRRPVDAPDEGYLFDLDITLDDIAEPTRVRVDMEDAEGTRTIFDEERSPNDRFRISAIGQNPEATFVFYYNDVEVKRVTRSAGEQ